MEKCSKISHEPMANRRALSVTVIAFIIVSVVSAAMPLWASSKGATLPASAVWDQYKHCFIQQDGRVIDSSQKDFSHSEAQAFGLLLSLKFNDRIMFQKIARWTRNNMQLRKGDSLLCWSWGRRPCGLWQIRDYNNASDADILFAWAMLRAADKWKDKGLHSEALKMIRDIRTQLFLRHCNRLVLLPGYYGFVRGDSSVEYNPSYFIPVAFMDFASAGDDPAFWKQVIEDGFRIEGKCAFGRFALPANWVNLGQNGITLCDHREGKYGFDAVRVFLYNTLWLETVTAHGDSGQKGSVARVCISRLEKFLDFCSAHRWIPSEVRLRDDFVHTDDACAGFYMIYSRAMAVIGKARLAQRLRDRAYEKINEEKPDYYSYSLFLLALY